MRNLILTMALVGLATVPAAAQNFPAMGTDSAKADAMDTDATTAVLGREHIVEMLKTGQADEAWFSESFLAQIPITEVNSVVQEVLQYAGTYKSIHGAKPKYTAVFTKGTDVITIKFNPEKKIDYLLFAPVK